MRERLRDNERLCHILNAIKSIEDGVMDTNEIRENSLEYFGIVKLIEIIGEAVYKLTNEFKADHPETPWKEIERMRHVLVHGYYAVGADFIWEVVENDLPHLKTQIERYIDEISE